MLTEELQVGIIGIGIIALAVHIPATYRDWRVMLEKSPLDAVVIATPRSRGGYSRIADPRAPRPR
jgi:hypothetical protein